MSRDPTPELLRKGDTPVPWIVPWTGESDPLALLMQAKIQRGALRMSYLDERQGDFSHGVLWVRPHPPALRGKGRPLFANTYGPRQRACMLDPRCQVCGVRLSGSDIPFLLFAASFEEIVGDGPVNTFVPPVCTPCTPVARKFCDAMHKSPTVAVLAASVTVSGVEGVLYELDVYGNPRPVYEGPIPIEDARRLLVLADKVALTLHGLRPAKG